LGFREANHRFLLDVILRKRIQASTWSVDSWANWSGSVRCTPRLLAEPKDETEVARLVQQARAQGQSIRSLGSGHSSSPLVGNDDVVISFTGLRGVTTSDRDRCEAVVRAGTPLHEAGSELHRLGLALPNLGDIDRQTIAGACMTGTHGTGQRLRNLADMLVGDRFVAADGSIQDFSLEAQPDLTMAFRVSLGTLGLLTDVRLRLLPTYRLCRREWCVHISDCLEHLDELVSGNRSMDFYWYLRSDEVKIRTMNLEDQATADLPFARCVEEETDWSHRVVAQERTLRFEEMEYALPAEAGADCFREIRTRVKERHRHIVGWRILYRTVSADDAWLSPAYGRDTVTVSLHQNATLPYLEYFADIEPIFRSYGGRPHWGKKHSLTASDLRALYPAWDRFQAMRQRWDPEGVFLTPALRTLLTGD
jgi:FAD/FMN-containing dehydrogenase